MAKDIQNGLENDARHLVCRLPENPTQEDIRQVATDLERFMAENNFSGAKIAALIGYSKTVVSEFLAGRYRGSNKAIANKVVNLINDAAR